MMVTCRLHPRRGQAGLSIVELMVALTIGFIVLAAMSGVFVNSNRSHNEMQKSAQQQESGRYASQLLAENLRLAGYMAEFDSTPLATPATLPDPCATAVADLLTALPLHVQGVNGDGTTPSCVADRKSGTDIIVVRRVSTCAAGATDCGAFIEGVPHFQASLCTPTDGSNAELAHTVSNVTVPADYMGSHFVLSTAAADFTLRKVSCGATDIAAIQRYMVHVYFIANNNEAGDGIPTLKRAELGNGEFNIVPLVDGIENMQIEYGVDSDGDGAPNSYSSTLTAPSDWRNAMTARVHLLARNTETTRGYSDGRTYTLGDTEVAAPGDAYKRHAYSSSVQFVNPSWRRQ